MSVCVWGQQHLPASITRLQPWDQQRHTHQQLCSGTTVLSHQCFYSLQTAICRLSSEIFIHTCSCRLAEYLRKQENEFRRNYNHVCVCDTRAQTHSNTLRHVNSCLLALKVLWLGFDSKCPLFMFYSQFGHLGGDRRKQTNTLGSQNRERQRLSVTTGFTLSRTSGQIDCELGVSVWMSMRAATERRKRAGRS